MTNVNGNVPANEALAAWDNVHNAREDLNGLIDAFPDFNLHEPEGRVSADTLSDLKTAVALLEEVNTRLDVAGEREAPSHNRVANREEPCAHATVKATAPIDAAQSARGDASLAAFELKAMLDVLNAAAASNVTLFDQTLEAYGATMLDKVQAVCNWFQNIQETER